MAVELNDMKAKYADRFEISEGNGWLTINELTPMGDDFPATQRPAFLEYNVDVLDTRFSDTLDGRSRNVWLRNTEGRGFKSVSYDPGLGIWQVSENGEPTAFCDLDLESREMFAEWLKTMDAYVSESIPELEQIIKERND